MRPTCYAIGLILIGQSVSVCLISLDLISALEKPRFKSFLHYILEYKTDDSKTWDGFDASVETMLACYTKFKLDASSADFTARAIALYHNDEYASRLYLIKCSHKV